MIENNNNSLDFFELLNLTEHQKASLLNLWNNEYPKYLNYNSQTDFNTYLDNLKIISHVLICKEKEIKDEEINKSEIKNTEIKNKEILAWLFIFERENENWFGIIISSKLQKKGFGTKLLNIAKDKYSQLNDWVIEHNNDLKANGQNYISPLHFYLKNGFEILPQIRLELEFFKAVKIKWQKN